MSVPWAIDEVLIPLCSKNEEHLGALCLVTCVCFSSIEGVNQRIPLSGFFPLYSRAWTAPLSGRQCQRLSASRQMETGFL